MTVPFMLMLPETLAILMVVAVCGFLFFGYPVALTLGGVSLAFAGLGHLTGAMSFSFIVSSISRNDMWSLMPVSE